MNPTTTTGTNNFSAEALLAFRLRLRGEVLRPGDEGYEAAREIHNATIDRRPALIVKVRDASDVSRSIHFARKHGLPLAVRAGGHSLPGHSLVEGGLVIDMSEMNAIRIDPEQRTAWAQPGATAGAFADEAQKYGLAVPFGDAASVGLGGITLGGGIGFLVRKHGLTIDHLVAIELVTAEGQIVQTSETENAELFWGLRGGGGNFGVVTGFQYQLVEVGTVYGGALVLPATKEVIKRYAEVSHEAPEELTTITMVMHAPPAPFIPAERVGELVLAIFTVYAGDLGEGEKAVAPLRALAEPVADLLGPMPYASIYDFTAEATVRRREMLRSRFYRTLDDGMVEAMLEHMEQAPSPFVMTQLRPLGGQMARIAPTATAFGHRAARFLVAIIDLWEDPADDAANEAWTERYWAAIAGYGQGVYSNFLEDEGEARIREAYLAESYERLAALKARWDPANVFSGNQNILPKVLRAAA